MKTQKGYVDFLKKLFVGRTDVLAVYWNNSKKSGYSPLCSNKAATLYNLCGYFKVKFDGSHVPFLKKCLTFSQRR